MDHIAKICWWVPEQKNIQDSEIRQTLATLTLKNTVADT
jgi:hypothetical protein